MRGIVVIVVLLSVLSCATNTRDLEPISQIAPTAATEGSLANETLTADTREAFRTLLGERIQPNTEILKFVIQGGLPRPKG